MPKKPMTVAELTSKAGKIGGKVTQSRRNVIERQEFARQGGLAGGAARAGKLSPRKRSEIAKKAAAARWAKKKV